VIVGNGNLVSQAARTRTILKAAFHKRLTEDEKDEVEYR